MTSLAEKLQPTGKIIVKDNNSKHCVVKVLVYYTTIEISEPLAIGILNAHKNYDKAYCQLKTNEVSEKVKSSALEASSAHDKRRSGITRMRNLTRKIAHSECTPERASKKSECHFNQCEKLSLRMVHHCSRRIKARLLIVIKTS